MIKFHKYLLIANGDVFAVGDAHAKLGFVNVFTCQLFCMSNLYVEALDKVISLNFCLEIILVKKLKTMHFQFFLGNVMITVNTKVAYLSNTILK